jgi:hypothetical protein
MMAKVIGCDVKQLTKFCKYINVFVNNIKSSPKSIKNKIIESKKLMRGSLSVLPEDMLEEIVNKYKSIFKIKYVLKDWIPLEKLNLMHLSKNPNAIDLLRKYPKIIDWEGISYNPNAIELLKEKIDKEYKMSENEFEKLDDFEKINWNFLSANPNAIEILKANPEEIDWGELSENTNPEAIKLLRKKIDEENYLRELNLEAFKNLDDNDKINWKWLSSNPSAIELLKANLEKIAWDWLSMNPSAIELLKANLEKIDWNFLSLNPNTEAIELLIANQQKIDWEKLSGNPSAIELLKANPEKINWRVLSSNPNAIELLEAKPAKINWFMLSRNPSIFDEILE